jgi:hypothetical protein
MPAHDWRGERLRFFALWARYNPDAHLVWRGPHCIQTRGGVAYNLRGWPNALDPASQPVNEQCALSPIRADRPQNHERWWAHDVDFEARTCLILDFDATPTESLAKLRSESLLVPPPHYLMQTSAKGKYHCVWFLTPCDPVAALATNVGLAQRYNGDLQVARAIRAPSRIPGSLHSKPGGVPYTSRILETTDAPAYDLEEFCVPLECAAPRPNQTRKSKAENPAVSQYLNGLRDKNGRFLHCPGCDSPATAIVSEGRVSCFKGQCPANGVPVHAWFGFDLDTEKRKAEMKFAI